MLLNCGVGEDSWESWAARRSNQSILKEISPEYSLEGLMLKLKLQSFGHLIWRTESLENTLMLGKIEDRRRRGWHRMRWLDGISNSMEWVWVSSWNWWWTRKPDVLYSMGPKELDKTEWHWTEVLMYKLFTFLWTWNKFGFVAVFLWYLGSLLWSNHLEYLMRCDDWTKNIAKGITMLSQDKKESNFVIAFCRELMYIHFMDKHQTAFWSTTFTMKS